MSKNIIPQTIQNLIGENVDVVQIQILLSGYLCDIFDDEGLLGRPFSAEHKFNVRRINLNTRKDGTVYHMWLG